jgi:hypothetical protein
LGSESETCVGSRVRLVGVSISSEKNFYRLPFTPPLSGSPYRSFSYSKLWRHSRRRVPPHTSGRSVTEGQRLPRIAQTHPSLGIRIVEMGSGPQHQRSGAVSGPTATPGTLLKLADWLRASTTTGTATTTTAATSTAHADTATEDAGDTTIATTTATATGF